MVLLSALFGGGAASATVPAVDLREAVQRRQVELKVVGQGLSSIHLSARASSDLRVTVEAGTLFAPPNEQAQRMVVTRSAEVTLRAGVWVEMTVATACANAERRVPDEHDRFELTSTPPELERLVQCLAQKNVPDSERQVAVWAALRGGTTPSPGQRTLETDNLRRLVIESCVAQRGESKRASCTSRTKTAMRLLGEHLEKRGVALVDECGRKL